MLRTQVSVRAQQILAIAYQGCDYVPRAHALPNLLLNLVVQVQLCLSRCPMSLIRVDPPLFPMKWPHVVGTGCRSVSGTGGHLYTRSFRDPEFTLWPLHVVLESLSPLASVTTEALDSATLFSWNVARLPFGCFCSREWETETEREKRRQELNTCHWKRAAESPAFPGCFFPCSGILSLSPGDLLKSGFEREKMCGWGPGRPDGGYHFSEWARTQVKRFSHS